ncbi:squalene epoxidase-domain-containing protein [Podospora aff. communis PSN243]|uniref:Squalene monooxygenase n=1 Tax=Podospora aff. communis PSN243 TaxID=3040156 RepID=A0AAV9GRN4_9PEZI|nr:squalene epoxidase-domain-containing protein [Podospora aff. communis PSN243]
MATANPHSQAARNAERRNKYHEADVVVVGAGVFGCAIAYALASQGRSVILLERSMKEPDRIVGELLQPGGVAALKKLGLERCLEGIDAVACYGYHVLFHKEEVVFPYPVMDGEGGVLKQGAADGTANGKEKVVQRRRPEGRSFHHGRFIGQLRKACGGHANISMFETEVVKTINSEHTDEIVGVQTQTWVDREAGERKEDFFFGQLTIIADGYASKFRKDYLERAPVVRSKFYALELIDCPFPPQGYGHVVIGKAMPVLLYQIGTHETRALIDVPANLPAASVANGGVRGYIEKVVVPTLPEGVRPSVLAALKANPAIPKSMPNSYLPPTRQGRHAGVILLGDAYNMRHPLTGGGMTVAFNDAVLLAELIHPDRIPDLGRSSAIRSAMDEFYSRRKSLTSIINVLAQALYSLFAAENRQLRALQAGCFRYFEMGITDEPVAMLGGMMRRPLTLAYHFFSVAFVAIWINAVEVCGGSILGIWKAPMAIIDAVLILWTASVVFLPTCWNELK